MKTCPIENAFLLLKLLVNTKEIDIGIQISSVDDIQVMSYLFCLTNASKQITIKKFVPWLNMLVRNFNNFLKVSFEQSCLVISILAHPRK